MGGWEGGGEGKEMESGEGRKGKEESSMREGGEGGERERMKK